MHPKAQTPQHSNPIATSSLEKLTLEKLALENKWLGTLVAAVGVTLVSVPAHAQTVLATVTASASSSWITATIVSVSTVVGLWIAAVILSGLARKLRWVSPHRHSRMARGVQVAFGGLLLLAMMMPYLAMNHPVMAAGLVATVLFMMIVVTSRNRQLSSESN